MAAREPRCRDETRARDPHEARPEAGLGTPDGPQPFFYRRTVVVPTGGRALFCPLPAFVGRAPISPRIGVTAVLFP